MLSLDIAHWLADALAWFPDWLITFIISMTPFVELRLSLPLAIAIYHMPWQLAFAIAVIGNVIIIPFILIFLGRIERRLRKYKWWDRKIDWFFERTRKRASKNIKRYEILGLCLFVAIPLPVTGAWTGSLLAFLMHVRARRAFPCIVAGVLSAGVVVTLVTIFGRETFRIFINM